ncbi:hypothetical protein [Gordonia shandongensis]|uniref:hypothetical protein n=1 Tax=Gordonia shandongensis TaxID=376351 RepID=UPI001FE16D54|nr:hypothetical protein [Gordonia shandongensis]
MNTSMPPRRSTALPRRTAVIGAAATIAAATLLTACSTDESTTDDGPCAPAAASKDDGSRSIGIPDAEVTLQSPGSDPAPLRRTPSIESAQRVRLETSSVEASLVPAGDGRQEAKTTEQQLVTPLTARTVCDDESSTEFTVGTPTSKDDELSALLPALDGSTGGLSFSDRMTPTRLRLKPREESESPARSALEQSLISALDYTVPLPTDPVGPGATWRSVRTVSAAATVTQTMTVTLAARRGDVLDLRVDVDEVPVNAIFTIPGSTSRLHINRYSMSGSGTVTVDLNRVFPVGGGLTLRGARELVGDDPDQPLIQRNEFTLAWKRS